MPDPRLDVLCIGNAIVDVIADADDEFLAIEGLAKGTMRLIDAEEAERLYAHMAPAVEASGGSAANTAAGIAALGGSAGFVGQLADDQLGSIFDHDIRSLGVEFATPPKNDVGPTARCLILVTPDAQRTMNTFLGAAQMLGPESVDTRQIADAKIVYLEGYLWDPAAPRAAMHKAMDAARESNREVAFTLSDSFVVNRHRADLMGLLDKGRIDILFANQAEIEAFAEVAEPQGAVAAIAPKVQTLVVTRSEHGALAIRGGERAEVAAEPIDKLVDTTGAGDLFAAGFLLGTARGKSLEESLRLGAICAAEVIQHYGARPEADLRLLARELLA